MHRITFIVAGTVLGIRAAYRGARLSVEAFRQPSTAAGRTGTFRLSLTQGRSTIEVAGHRAFPHAAPGNTQSYEMHVPRSHTPGLFWHRPYPHGFFDIQRRSCMSGALIVEGCWIRFRSVVRGARVSSC